MFEAEGARRMKRMVTWGLVAFLVFYVVTQPGDAAGVMRSIGNGLRSIAVGLGNFVSNLT
jgi:hypothetical protein